MTEEQLEGIWIVDPIKKSRLAAVVRHLDKHKDALGTDTLEQYVRQAIAFREEAKSETAQESLFLARRRE